MPESTSPTAGAARPPIGLIALRWASLTVLLALTGLLAFVPAPFTGSRLVSGLALFTPLLLAAHLAVWAAHAAPGAGLGAAIGPALQTDSGRLDALRALCGALAAGAVLLARRPRLGFAFAVAAVLASAGIGHALGTAPAVALPAKGVHLVAAALWLGGLLAIASAPPGRPDAPLARRVSTVAFAAVVVIAVTGVAQSLVLLPDLDAVVGSTYGRFLLAKVAGLLLLLGFGAYHRLRLLPRIRREPAAEELGVEPAAERLRRSVRREVAVVLVVLLVAAVLAHVPPPGYAPADPPTTWSEATP